MSEIVDDTNTAQIQVIDNVNPPSREDLQDIQAAYRLNRKII